MTQNKFPTSQGGRHFKHLHFVADKPTIMEIEEETTDYMDVDPPILMLREEGAY